MIRRDSRTPRPEKKRELRGAAPRKTVSPETRGLQDAGDQARQPVSEKLPKAFILKFYMFLQLFKGFQM